MEQTLGCRIMENRKRLKMTQDQLAEKLGVTAQAVSKWENDQSCPDITMLPKLADIFDTTTDTLLGREEHETVHNAEVVDEDKGSAHNGRWEFHWENGRRSALGFAVLVIMIGALYLASQILQWDVDFWDILWPSCVLIFGLWGLADRFSFFRIGCVLFGGYTLADHIFQFNFDMDGKLIWAVLIIVFGLSLLADALNKPKKPRLFIKKPGISIKKANNETVNDYHCEGDSFSYNSSFGEYRQLVALNTLKKGEVCVSFGEYTIDLSEVKELAEDCRISAACSFGELRFLVPNRFRVITNHNTAFANLEIVGSPNEQPDGMITLDGGVSFGEISIVYI